jgi:Concanavalin A-like lectin/glucanases superfamily
MDKTKEAASRIAEKFTNVAGKSTIAMFIIIALILIVIIVVYIVYRMKRSDLQNVVILKNSLRLYNMKETYKFEAYNLPPTLNGQEYSYSFWLYLVEYPPMNSHALLFSRSQSGQSVHQANPVVFLDKSTNKLHVAVRTTMPASTPLTESMGTKIFDTILDRQQSGFLTTTIEYVPLQRWVHIAFVVQDNLLTLYMDGDIYTVANLFDMPRPSGVRPVFASSSGDVYIGYMPSLPAQPRAFLGKTQFYNFALMHKDVRSVYSEGPTVQKILGRMGLPEYGLRTPIYRLDK